MKSIKHRCGWKKDFALLLLLYALFQAGDSAEVKDILLLLRFAVYGSVGDWRNNDS